MRAILFFSGLTVPGGNRYTFFFEDATEPNFELHIQLAYKNHAHYV